MANNIDPSLVGASSPELADIKAKYAMRFAKSDNAELGQADFLKLLSEQFKNQDFNNPTENTEFIAQMAQFTALQSQNEATYYTKANYMNALVGKTVVVTAGTAGGIETVEGIVSGVNVAEKDGQFTVLVNGKSYAYENIMVVKPAVSQTDYYNMINSASSIIGKKVLVEDKDGKVEGLVKMVAFTGSGYKITLDNGKSYDYGAISKVLDADFTAPEEPEEPEEPGEGEGEGGDTETPETPETPTP